MTIIWKNRSFKNPFGHLDSQPPPTTPSDAERNAMYAKDGIEFLIIKNSCDLTGIDPE
jgi:hypothetical protein